MKITYSDVLAGLSVLAAIKGEVGKKLKTKAAKMMRELQPKQEDYEIELLDLQDRHVQTDASGIPVENVFQTKDGEGRALVFKNRLAYQRDLKALLAKEGEVNLEPLTLADIKTKGIPANYVLTHEQMAAMGPLLALSGDEEEK
ncbi:MAG TPA: hypothetical protein PK788_12115 [Gemmatimonadaceae bacterium]|nr:hypothetical protein [Gemmatimonadaceae bacterium]